MGWRVMDEEWNSREMCSRYVKFVTKPRFLMRFSEALDDLSASSYIHFCLSEKEGNLITWHSILRTSITGADVYIKASHINLQVDCQRIQAINQYRTYQYIVSLCCAKLF